jgi:hypothetical protein
MEKESVGFSNSLFMFAAGDYNKIIVGLNSKIAAAGSTTLVLVLGTIQLYT